MHMLLHKHTRTTVISARQCLSRLPLSAGSIHAPQSSNRDDPVTLDASTSLLHYFRGSAMLIRFSHWGLGHKERSNSLLILLISSKRVGELLRSVCVCACVGRLNKARVAEQRSCVQQAEGLDTVTGVSLQKPVMWFAHAYCYKNI